MIRKLLKQKRIPVIGGLYDVLALTAIWIGMVNFILIAITAYSTTIRPGLGWEWFSLPLFLLFLVLLALGVMAMVYKFVVPSYYSFRGGQYDEHGGQTRERLEEISKRLEDLERSRK